MSRGLGDVYKRQTVVATGLSKGNARRAAPPLQVLRTGTDNVPFAVAAQETAAPAAAATPSSMGAGIPAVWRTGRTHAAARVDGMASAGMDDIEIPAFLRKQAD